MFDYHPLAGLGAFILRQLDKYAINLLVAIITFMLSTAYMDFRTEQVITERINQYYGEGDQGLEIKALILKGIEPKECQDTTQVLYVQLNAVDTNIVKIREGIASVQRQQLELFQAAAKSYRQPVRHREYQLDLTSTGFAIFDSRDRTIGVVPFDSSGLFATLINNDNL